MRLLVFAPSDRSSAIGRSSRLISDALVRLGHEVVSIATESDAMDRAESHRGHAEVIPWSDLPRVSGLVRDADLVVYHIGDHFGFHEGALAWLEMKPGVVCLHDFYLGNLFQGWSVHRRDQADAVLRRLYGDRAASTFFGHTSMEEFVAATADTAPMTEWVCEKATGVVTHSDWGNGRVLRSCAGPVSVIPLAYDLPSVVADEASATRHVEALRVLTVGHANWNKRIDSVIRAIGAEPELRTSVVYRHVGVVDDEVAAEYRELADSLGVMLELSGPVTDAELVSALRAADIVSCLRRPTLEAASASAIEAMLSGKPILVTDVGFYAELPDHAVIKIDPVDEVRGVAQALMRLLSAPDLVREIGESARTWAAGEFSAEGYARGLVEIGRATLRAEPTERAIRRMVGMLAEWGCASDAAVIDAMLRPLEVFEIDSRGPRDQPGATRD